MKNVLIIGATGKLGNGVFTELLKHSDRYNVGVLVRNPQQLFVRENLEIFEGDILTRSLERPIQWADIIINCSGFVSYKRKDRRKLHIINVEGVRNLITYCQRSSKPLIHTSSAIAYGSSNNPFYFTESYRDESNYRGFYAITKEMADNEVRDSGIPWIILRPGTLMSTLKNLYGFYKKGFVAQLKGGASFSNLEDVCSAYIQSIDYLLSEKESQIFNLGGNNLEFEDVFEVFTNLDPQRTRLVPSNLMSSLSFVSDYILEPLFKKSILTRDNFKTGSRFTFLDSTKAIKHLQYSITPFDHSVKNLLFNDNYRSGNS